MSTFRKSSMVMVMRAANPANGCRRRLGQCPRRRQPGRRPVAPGSSMPKPELLRISINRAEASSDRSSCRTVCDQANSIRLAADRAPPPGPGRSPPTRCPHRPDRPCSRASTPRPTRQASCRRRAASTPSASRDGLSWRSTSGSRGGGLRRARPWAPAAAPRRLAVGGVAIDERGWRCLVQLVSGGLGHAGLRLILRRPYRALSAMDSSLVENRSSGRLLFTPLPGPWPRGDRTGRSRPTTGLLSPPAAGGGRVRPGCAPCPACRRRARPKRLR